jgi:cytochrome c-type protein NapB
MKPRSVYAAIVLVAAVAAARGVGAEPFVDAARGKMPIAEATRPPLLGNAVNDDQIRPRSSPWQPPTIPHRVDGYQVDRNFNKCLDCHAREKTAMSLAVPVSATHYKDRDGKVLPQISTRRYFCQQCHVAQDRVPALVGNAFRGIDAGAGAPGSTTP